MEKELKHCETHVNVWKDNHGKCWICEREKQSPQPDVIITLTNDELSILKQLLRKEGEEFSKLQTNKAHKDVYVKVMQTKKGGR